MPNARAHKLQWSDPTVHCSEKRERRKNGKGGKIAREREKRRKPLPDFCRNMAPARGWLCTAMPVCWAVEQRSLKMAFSNFNNSNK